MSAELENIINVIVDKRVKELYEDGIKELEKRIKYVEQEAIVNQIEYNLKAEKQIECQFTSISNDISRIKETIEILDEVEMQQIIAKIMLDLMPKFKISISKEIKSHLVAIAKFVIENFKEKE